MCSCLENPEDIDVLNHTLKIIATHGWEKTEDTSFGYETIELLISRFSTLLQEAGVNIALIQEEWDDIYDIVCKAVCQSRSSFVQTGMVEIVQLIVLILSSGVTS